MRLLAFCFFPAFVPPSNGGQQRLFQLYRALSASCDVTLLTSTHIGGEEEIIRHGARFIERRVPKDDYFVREWAALEPFSAGGDLSGPTIAASGRWPTRLHQAYLEEIERADVVVHDFPFTVYYDLFAGLDGKPRVYNAHNCETGLYRRLHDDPKAEPIHDRVRRAETRLLEVADLVFHCSDDDLASLRDLVPLARFAAAPVPNGSVPLAVALTGIGRGAPAAAFVGSDHPPNREAAEFIVRDLAPRLPQVRFDIVGGCLAEGSYPPNVRRHGVVDEVAMERVLADAWLALNPMQSGGGSNVKVLDYLARGLPVLSTPFGMRGVAAEAGREYLSATAERFADALWDALADPARLRKVGEAGRALQARRYAWDVLARGAAEAIAAAAAAKAADPPPDFVLALNDYDSFASTGGGGVRTRGLYAAVSHWSPVVFVCFSADGSLAVRQAGDGITVLGVPMTAAHLAERDRFNAQFHVSSDDIVASRHCVDNPYLDAVYRVLRRRARCIAVEHCYMAPLPAAWGDRFVYSSHNCEADLKGRLLRRHPSAAELLAQVEGLERLAVEAAAATVTVSVEDATRLLAGKRTAGPTIVVRNGAEPPSSPQPVAAAADRCAVRVGERSVVFVGSAHVPNVQAAEFIVRNLAPACRDVEFHLIGTACDALGGVPANVRLWRTVDADTKSAVMRACALAINPMFEGGGSNVKLADYLAHGLYTVSTAVGRRGYPASIAPHVRVAALEDFAAAVSESLANPALRAEGEQQARRSVFERELAMESLAARFVGLLQDLGRRRRRLLFVTYRYLSPAQGGAEALIEKFLTTLGASGEFDIDVVAPEISAIHEWQRFGDTYSFDRQASALADVPRLRYARFPVDAPPTSAQRAVRGAWSVQPAFERAVSARLADAYAEAGPAWGWGDPEGGGRWALADCGIRLLAPATVQITGFVPSPAVMSARFEGGVLTGPLSVDGDFRVQFDAPAGEVSIECSAACAHTDARPLGMFVTRLLVDGQAVDLTAPPLWRRALAALGADGAFRLLGEAAIATRGAAGVRLTDGRGPWSSAMERFIAEHVADYDLLVTHNNVFRPAVFALEQARRHGVPSILVPHAHLDDDFYHFPDVLESARQATRVLAVPHAACSFLAEQGCAASYLPAGCDAGEVFTEADSAAFREVHDPAGPFVLVLGRKAAAKGYRSVIEAVGRLRSAGERLQVVLIGPDDDRTPVVDEVLVGR
jgi:glycosyltransferase involved in cell wall biosynthesis